MRLQGLGTYLIEGDRGAIHRLARSRASLPVGAILVLTASIARNHDGAWLPGEPQALTHGLLVSTVNAFLLYSLFFAMAMMKRLERPRFWIGYTQFLALFWLTSPMAWLYAIPYEHMTHPEGAVSLNALTLGLVSIWRVLIVARVMAVLWGSSMRVTLWPVLFFSDVVLLIGAFTMPMPIVNFMGGLQHLNPVDRSIVNLNVAVTLYGILTLPLWLITTTIAGAFFSGGWAVAPSGAAEARWRPSHGVLAMLACVAVVMGVLLATFQPAQSRRYEASRLLREDFGAGLAFMSRHERTDFPPIWDPPPRLWFPKLKPSMPEVRQQLAKDQSTPWVRAMFLEKSWDLLEHKAWTRWSIDLDPERYKDSLRFVDLDDGRFSSTEFAAMLDGLWFHVNHDERLTQLHRDDIRKWLEAVAQRQRKKAEHQALPGTQDEAHTDTPEDPRGPRNQTEPPDPAEPSNPSAPPTPTSPQPPPP